MLAFSFAAIPAVGIETFSETDFTRSELTAIAKAIAQMQPLPEAVTGQTRHFRPSSPALDGRLCGHSRSKHGPAQADSDVDQISAGVRRDSCKQKSARSFS